MSQSTTQKSPRSRRKQAQLKKTTPLPEPISSPQLPIEVWELVSKFADSFSDILSACSTCKYVYNQLDPCSCCCSTSRFHPNHQILTFILVSKSTGQKKTSQIIAELSDSKSESYRRVLRASAASGEPFSGLTDIPYTLMDQFSSWRDEYCMRMSDFSKWLCGAFI